MDDAFNFAAGLRSWNIHVNAIEITDQGHLLYKECLTEEAPRPLSPGFTIEDQEDLPRQHSKRENRIATLLWEEPPYSPDWAY